MKYSLFKGQHPPSKELLFLLERQATWDDEAGDQNPQGLHLRFVKIDEQVKPEGRVAARYRVFAEGAPENKVFAFTSWTLGNPLSMDPHDYYVNGQGLVMLHKPRPEQELSVAAPGDELVITTVTRSAEPIRFLFARRDGELGLYATLIPHPLISEEQGCRVEVRISQPDAMSVLVVADGFPAKDKVTLVIESGEETVSEALTTDADGRAVTAVFPFLPGKSQGVLKASAQGPNCLPQVVFPWGEEAHPAQKTP